MLQCLAGRKNKIICLHFLQLQNSGNTKEQNEVIGRLIDVKPDSFILVTFKNGRKNTRIYPYPTPGLQSISIDFDETEDSDILVQFHKEEYEYEYNRQHQNTRLIHPEV